MPKQRKHIDLSAKTDVLRRQSFLRPKTVELFVKSYENFLNSPPVHRRRHPASNKVGYPFRYKHGSTVKQKVVVTIESPGKSPKQMQPKGEALVQVEENTFLTPMKSGPFQRANTRINIITPGQHKTTMQVVEQSSVSGEKRKIDFENIEIKTVTTTLAYKQLTQPAQGKRIDNNRAHGESADQKAARAMGQFYSELKTQQLITHHEYTHAVAGHWGVVKEHETGEKRDPAAATSTFVAPAAFNTEMILFERFADFLVFINHHRHGYAKTKPSVQYSMTYQQDPQTLAISFAEITIKDLRTGMVFTHHWDNPSEITEKPMAGLFEMMIVFLKKSLDRKLADELVQVPVIFSDKANKKVKIQEDDDHSLAKNNENRSPRV